MRSIRFLSAILLIALCSTAFARYIELAPDVTFTIPVDSIESATFRDIDSDSWPEALLVGGGSIWLYSIEYDSVLFTATIPDQSFGQYSVTLADVNRDSIVDLILGSLDIARTRADVWDGESGYAELNPVTFGPFHHYWDLYPTPGIVAAADLDGDGYDELLISCERQSFDGGTFISRIAGGTVIYESFPSTVGDSSHLMSIQLDSLTDEDGNIIHLLTRNTMFTAEWPGTDYYQIWSWPGVVTASSPYDALVYESEEPLIAPWDDDVSILQTLNRWLFACGGDLDPNRRGTEFLVVRSIDARYSCFDDPCAYEPFDSTTLCLFSMIASDSSEEIRRRDITGQTWDNFLYQPEFPGYFFAFVDGNLVMYDVDADSIFITNKDVPVGIRSWTWPYPDKTPRLVVLDHNHVTLYRLDISTGINDQPHGELPRSFTLSQPYPNPFNPTVSFSITLPVKTLLTVEVYNSLGQRVERLFEGDLSAGEKRFVWNATDYASGVYLIKATTASETKSVKAVLVK